MRIGVNCYLLQSHIGGMKQYFHNLFSKLLEDDHSNEYIFFLFPQNEEEFNKLEVNERKISFIKMTDQSEVNNHLSKIDLYFCPLFTLWPRPLPVPTVVTIPDIQEVYFPGYFSKEDLYNREYHYIGSTKMADRVITISEFSKKTIIEHHRIPAHKIIVAYPCIDKRFYNYSKSSIPKISNLLPDGDFIFYPANHWLHKNHDTLLRALNILKLQRGLIINVIFTGYSVNNGYLLEEKIIEYNLEKQAFCYGYVTDEEIIYLYSKAKFLVFPSLFEGYGIPLVEAMATGCPVVAANDSAIPEIAGKAAEYFDPTSNEDIAKTIKKVWINDILRNQMILRGKERASQFSADNLIQTHLKAFEEAKKSFSKYRYLWNLYIGKY